MSFKTPATDACSTCLQLKSQMKLAQSGSVQKSDLLIQYRVHKLKLKAGAFYDILKKEKKNIIILSFDCQKNLVLPKIPDQSAYYSRQLYQYNLTVVRGHSKAKQNHENVTIYSWLENERLKGSNEICSALWDYLTSLDLTEVGSVLLCSEGCPGQNKNSIFMGMVGKWFKEFAPHSVKEVVVMYPVVGHSFLPPDRVFGRIEKVIRKTETVITPDEYINIFNQFGNVKKLGTEIPVFDWKSSVQECIKPPGSWHFRFSQAKRFIFVKDQNMKVLLQGEIHYKSDIGVPKSVLKQGKAYSSIKPTELQNKVPVKKEKLIDVDNLLKKHFGPEWRNNADLEYYRSVIDGSETGVSHTVQEEDPYNYEELNDLVI